MSWASKTPLQHRRTVILFNELHSRYDGLSFSDWLSPNAAGDQLWGTGNNVDAGFDNADSAIRFILDLVDRIWSRVVRDFRIVLDSASDHIIALVRKYMLAEYTLLLISVLGRTCHRIAIYR